MKYLSQLKSDYIVQYFHHWIEENNLYILTEYCFDNLRNILAIKPIVFERNENQAMNSIEYYISCEIFRQITEALNYLHSLKPEPLILRDLKPENILIGMSGIKRICKLSDIGLKKTEHISLFEKKNKLSEVNWIESENIETTNYRAPETYYSSCFDQKCDIWSLGMIALEIFDINDRMCNTDSFKFVKIEQLITRRMLNARSQLRISTEILLDEFEFDYLKLATFSIKYAEFENYIEIFTSKNLPYFIDILKGANSYSNS